MNSNTQNSGQGSQYGTVPNQVYGYENGANPRQNALNYQLENDAEQAEMAAAAGGGRRRRGMRGSRRRHRKRGGQAAGTEMEVPSFPTVGPATSPLTSTSVSVAANQSALDAQVASCNDCYATGTCGQTMGCPQQGGRRHAKPKGRKTRRGGRRRSYAVSAKRVNASPFKNQASLRRTLKRHRSGKRIGFTQRSSLRSMGLIPRKDGTYRLGRKYSR